LACGSSRKTVNFDDPGTYHFYYGDEAGHPGTILTFFPWEQAAAGRNGVGQTQQTAFRVPARSLGYWTHRFIEKGVTHEALEKRFGESVLPFTDPDGMSLALVSVPDARMKPAGAMAMSPPSMPSRLSRRDAAARERGENQRHSHRRIRLQGNRARRLDHPADGRQCHRRHRRHLRAKGFLPGRQGRGSVHHVAFRAVDDADQAEMARKLVETHGQRPTEQKDRNYFRSVYFREPGGILFEIAFREPAKKRRHAVLEHLARTESKGAPRDGLPKRQEDRSRRRPVPCSSSRGSASGPVARHEAIE